MMVLKSVLQSRRRLFLVAWLLFCVFIAKQSDGATNNALVLRTGVRSSSTEIASVAEQLKKLGFETEQADCKNRDALRQTIQQFAQRVPNQSTAVIYAQGVTATGEYKSRDGKRTPQTYLLPDRTNVNQARDVSGKGVSLQEIADIMGQQSGCGRFLLLVDAADAGIEPPVSDATKSAEAYDLTRFQLVSIPVASCLAISVSETQEPSDRLAKMVQGVTPGKLAAWTAKLLKQSEPKQRFFVSSQSFSLEQANSDAGVRYLGSIGPGKFPGQEWTNSVGQVFCWCPPGAFTMGSPESESERDDDEGPIKVQLTKGFWISKYELTEREYSLLRKRNAKKPRGKLYPYVDARHGDALNAAKAITERERKAGTLPKDWAYTMPTEAEWEYACRAGSTTAYCFGDSSADLHRFGNFADATLFRFDPSLYRYASEQFDDGFDQAAPVGSYLPNAWGIHDMHGNVWEWCRDEYSELLAGGDDPSGPEKSAGRGRVIRGGSWISYPAYCRSSMRQVQTDLNVAPYLGIRLILKPSE